MEPLDILSDIEETLQIECAPLTWPIGMGKRFKGAYNLYRKELTFFTPGQERLTGEAITIRDLKDPLLDEKLGSHQADELREDVALLEGAVQLFRPVFGNDFILGAVGVLQFDVTMARLKAEYEVAAVYEPVDYAAARWVSCDDRKRLAAFEKANQANLALDAEGNLTYLAGSEWLLKMTSEKWPDITFRKTRENN